MSAEPPSAPITRASARAAPHPHRTGRYLAIAGILWFVGPPVLCLLGPGYVLDPLTAADLLVWGSVIVGIVLILMAVRSRSPSFSPATLLRGKGGWGHPSGPAARGVLAVTALLVVAIVLLAFGVVPGGYLPPTGSVQREISGCGGVAASRDLATGFPFGFPPGAVVHLRWATENATDVNVTTAQLPPVGGATLRLANENGSSGELNFVGSGGRMYFSAALFSGKCPHTETVDVDWSYGTTL